MFIRNERSIKEFIQYYPVVSILVMIHLALWLFIDFLQLPLGHALYNWGVGNNYLISEGQYWRLITPILLHGGLMHALFNSFTLVLFGPALEQMLGKVKFIIGYFGAGLIGSIATFLIAPPNYSHVGASGAIFGLFGIYIFMVLFRKHLIDQANTQIVLTIFVIGLVMTFLRPGINIYAHIFGFIGGFILAPLLLTKGVQGFSPWRNVRRSSTGDGGIQFDPNRWKKRRLPPSLLKNIIWIILGILVLFGILARFSY
jgi:membrane associated rhomboid family serine protease